MGGAAILLLFGYSSGSAPTVTGDGPLTSTVERSPMDATVYRIELTATVAREEMTSEVKL